MSYLTSAGTWSLLFASLFACDRDVDDGARSAPTPSPEVGKTPSAKQPASSGIKWPTASCTILASDGVAKVVGVAVKPREQYAICDYLTDRNDGVRGVSVHYYNNQGGGGEYEIFKGLQDERGGKSMPVTGLGKEALEGNSGTGAGLAVQMADGRSFMVVGGNKEQRFAVAELVLAVR